MSLAQLVDRLQHRGQVVNVVAANDPAPAATEIRPITLAAFDDETDVVHQVSWRELDAAYLAHHVNCKVCIAAGRGIQYGLRCGAGASLWSLYSDAIKTATL